MAGETLRSLGGRAWSDVTYDAAGISVTRRYEINTPAPVTLYTKVTNPTIIIILSASLTNGSPIFKLR